MHCSLALVALLICILLLKFEFLYLFAGLRRNFLLTVINFASVRDPQH